MCLFLLIGKVILIENENYMRLALNEAKKAFKKNEVPVGAVIVKNGKVIARAYNEKETKKNAIKHAEIIAIEKACKKIQNWHLDDCEIYITLEPCMMCMGAICESRIKKIVYSASSPKYGASHYLNQNKKIIIEKDILKDESVFLLKSFFYKKR